MRIRGIGAVGDFWRVVREFNPEGIEREATAPLDLWLLGEPGSGRRTLAGSFLSADGRSAAASPFRIVDIDFQQGRPAGIEGADLVILVVRVDQDLADLGPRTAALLGRIRVPLMLVFTGADNAPNTREMRNAAFRAFSFASHLRMVFVDARDAAQVEKKVVPVMLDAVPELRTPLARRIPAARARVADQIIAETCRVNAQFALAANLPANLPFLGSVAGSVADLFVLTKNQVMMVLRLAAIYGRDITPTLDVAAEIAPVIGGGFVWRSAARMVVGLLPTFLAAAPKTAIAYVGTYTAGQAARYYYDQGRKPAKQLLASFSADGARLYRRMLGLEGDSAGSAA